MANRMTVAETRRVIHHLMPSVLDALPGSVRMGRLMTVMRQRISELPVNQRGQVINALNTARNSIPNNRDPNMNNQEQVGNYILDNMDFIGYLATEVEDATSDLQFITQILELRRLAKKLDRMIPPRSDLRDTLIGLLGAYDFVLTAPNTDHVYNISTYNMSGNINPDLVPMSNSNSNNNNERGLAPRRLFNTNGNNNSHNYAAWANRQAREIMNSKSKKFAAGTKWGVKANKNNAKEWYNSATGKLKNVTANNVYANGIGGDVFKPGQLKNLYFNANAKGSAARKLYTSRTIKQSQGKNPYTQQPIKPRKLTSNMINAVRESMKRRGVNSTKNAKKILGKNATKAAIKKKAMELYMNN